MSAYRNAQRSCPACPAYLSQTTTPVGTNIEQCGSCGGQWIDWGEFTDLLERINPFVQMEFSSREGGSRLCPYCARRLTAVSFGTIPLDKCEEHGLWFDHSELEASLYTHLHFVESLS